MVQSYRVALVSINSDKGATWYKKWHADMVDKLTEDDKEEIETIFTRRKGKRKIKTIFDRRRENK